VGSAYTNRCHCEECINVQISRPKALLQDCPWIIRNGRMQCPAEWCPFGTLERRRLKKTKERQKRPECISMLIDENVNSSELGLLKWLLLGDLVLSTGSSRQHQAGAGSDGGGLPNGSCVKACSNCEIHASHFTGCVSSWAFAWIKHCFKPTT